ncbi:MAG: folylpolyglutamate synthase/dihydrofolate synthase family protein [archaeon]
MSYEKDLEYIYGRERFGIKLGLKNISELMAKLGNPQDKFNSVHVAGTNGKGSVCAFLASILEQEGYKVGVYTSPHLVDFRERIRINEKKISKKDISEILAKIKPHIKDHTFFEIVTALAFLYFTKEKVDIAIIEVGMGGRLDATNVITPLVSAITNISLEHTCHLGETVDKIAFEKAGIIKEKVPVVVSEDCKGLEVIKKVVGQKGAKLYLAERRKIDSALKGDFQYANVSLALEILEILKSKGFKSSVESIAKGLNAVKWPGRLDFISKNILFDCAHNPNAAKALEKELKKIKKAGKDIYIVLGIMKDKDIEHIVSELEDVAKEIIITRPHIARAAMPDTIAGFVHKKVSVIGDISDSLEYAKLKAGKNGLVVVTGSIFTVGEAFSILRPNPFSTKQKSSIQTECRQKQI